MRERISFFWQRFVNAPYVSEMLVFINVIVFLICTFTGTLLYNKGSIGALNLFDGEYYRMVSSLFLHADIRHLVNNMLLLFGLGMMIEKQIGHIRFGVYFMLSGLGGNILSVLMELISGDFVNSVGASGAVFGLDGVLLALVLFSGRRFENVTGSKLLLVIAYSLYSGFASQNINNAAHIGGLLTGFVLATGYCFRYKIRQSHHVDGGRTEK